MMVNFLKKINLKHLDQKAIVAFIMSVIAITNVILRMCNHESIDVDEVEVSNVVSAAALIITTLYSMYRNFNVTEESACAQEVINSLKDQCNSLTINEVETLLNNTTSSCDTNVCSDIDTDTDVDNIDESE